MASRQGRLTGYTLQYQHTNEINIGCDPPGFPTADYIQSVVYSSAVFVERLIVSTHIPDGTSTHIQITI